jgi:hypothetical protein
MGKQSARRRRACALNSPEITPVDVARVEELLARHGKGYVDLDRAAKTRGNARRMHEGQVPRPPHLASWASELATSVDALCPTLGPVWHHASYAQPGSIKALNAEMEHAKSILTFHKCVEYYVLPLRIHALALKSTQDNNYVHQWSAPQYNHYTNTFLGMGKQIRERNTRLIHRIITRESFFRKVFHPDWFDETIAELKKYQDSTLLVLLDDVVYSRVEAELDLYIPSLCPVAGWEKLYVIDNSLVAIRTPYFSYVYTYHRPTAEKVLNHLHLLLEQSVPTWYFPTVATKNLVGSQLRAGTSRTVDRLKDVILPCCEQRQGRVGRVRS